MQKQLLPFICIVINSSLEDQGRDALQLEADLSLLHSSKNELDVINDRQEDNQHFTI